MALRVYVESIGCRLNQSERDTLAREFVVAGWEVVPNAVEADVCVVNTCAVTQAASRKSRQHFRSLRRANPSARLVATGCYTGLHTAVDDPAGGAYSAEQLDVDLVVTNAQKQDLVSLVERELGTWGLVSDAGECGLRDDRVAALYGSYGWDVSAALPPRTRPLVKIQDGCDNACAYCIVHVLRGPQRSRSRQDILDEIAEWVFRGYHEVVLTGVHVGAYGHDTGDTLAGLVRAILDCTPPDRLRLSSIEPWDLAASFLSLWQDPRLCRHLHLPLQSGSDATLRRMNRQYTAAQYAEWVAQAREAIPDLAVTTDVIAGFPGETESDHVDSVGFVERMRFARVHVFGFSPRPGTVAAGLPDQLERQVRQLRAAQIREIGRRSGEAFRRQFLGHTLPVLWEMRRVQGRWSGLTDNYIRVYTDSERDLANTLCPTRLLALDGRGVRGEVLISD